MLNLVVSIYLRRDEVNMANVLIIIISGETSLADEQGPASIVSYLEKNGHKVKFISAKRNKEFTYEYTDFIPEVIGLSVYHDDLYFAYDIAAKIKKMMRDVYIIMGGYSATYYYQEIFNSTSDIDFLMKGEGELSWKLICDNIDSGKSIETVPNLVYLNHEKRLVSNANAELLNDLDALGFASRDILMSKKLRIAHLSTSRGCFGNCSFCYSHKFFDPSGKVRWRGKTPKVIVEEMRRIVEEYGIHRIVFDDASFEDSIDGLKRIEEIANLIIQEDIKVTFEVFFRASIYFRLSEDLLNKLQKAGLSSVFIGIESFNEKELRLFNKHVSVSDNDRAISVFRKKGINVQIGFINFTPYSTVDTLRANVNLLDKHSMVNTYLLTNNLRAYKGTDLYERLKNEGLLCSKNELDYYGYRYETPVIGELCDFIKRQLSVYNKKLPHDIQYYDWFNFETYSNFISYYRSIYYKLGVELEAELEQWQNKYLEIIQECSHSYFVWYVMLLDLLERGWNDREAKVIFDQYFPYGLSQNVNKKLIQLLIKFHYVSLKYDKKLTEYFVKTVLE